MKTRLLTLLCLFIVGVGTIYAWNYEKILIDELCYNLDTTNQIAEVTTKPKNQHYSGDITIPNFVTYKDITFNVTSIGDYSFQACKEVTSVTIGNAVTSIGESAFNSTSIETINIPESVVSIGLAAFCNCSNLKTAIIGNSVTTIGSVAFQNCTNLVSVTIGNNVSVIGVQAFSNCESLSSITIPNSVSSIGGNAFYGCASLTSITIPNSVTSIGDDAFAGCTNLASVNIPSSVTSMGSGVFSGCTNMPVMDNIRYADTYLVEAIDKTLTTYSIKEGTRWIGNSAFSKCVNLTSIILPETISRINNGAFSECTNLMEVTIPSTVTSIDGSAFSKCTKLQSIKIPNSVTFIGSGAFLRCTGLSTLEIPNSVVNIGTSAFSKCSHLNKITLGAGLQKIDDYAFSECTGIRKIEILSDHTINITQYTFDQIESIGGITDRKQVNIYVPEDCLQGYQNNPYWGEFSVKTIGARNIIDADEEAITVMVDDNSADIVWPQIKNATVYILVIRNSSGEDICTLSFDENGYLTNVAFGAPSRNRTPQNIQSVAGFSFTINNLLPGTTYSYTMVATDNIATFLYEKNGYFTTTGISTKIVENPTQNSSVTKIYRNGQLFILRNGIVVNVLGQSVR